MRIALLVYNPIRDLAGLTLLATRLCAQGATCFLTPGDGRQREISALAPDFVLLSSLRRTKQEVVGDWQQAGIQTGVLDSEGGVLSSFEWYGDALATDVQIRERIKCYCSWGERLAQEAVQRGWYREDQVFVTGSPRFDFYAPPLSDVPLRKFPQFDRSDSPLVLINGKFSMANPGTGTPEKQTRHRLSKIRGYDENYVQEFLQTQTRGLHQLVELTNHLAKRFPGINFVYRPHPFEKLETYHKLLESHSNLHLIREGEILDWLRIADAVIQRSCTTAIEAGMVGIPAFSPDWVSMPEKIESVDAVSIHCKDQDELDEYITMVQQGSFQRPDYIQDAHKQVIYDWFHQIDGRSHERVAQVILGAMSSEKVERKHCRLLFNQQEGGKKASSQKFSFLGLHSRKAKLAKKSEHDEWLESPKYFDAAQVQSVIEMLRGCGIASNNLKVSSSLEREDYDLPMGFGRSVTLFAENG